MLVRLLPTRVLPLLAVVAIVLAGCGGDGEPEPDPKKVDPALAPVEVVDGKLKLFENVDEGTVSAFADAGETSLIVDGRLWEIRRAERLVGTLQISTVDPRVDLTESRERETIAREILAGATSRIVIRDIEVTTFSVQDRATYVWFGTELVQVLTVKGFDEIEPEQVLESVLAHQARQPAWEPLPVELTERS